MVDILHVGSMFQNSRTFGPDKIPYAIYPFGQLHCWGCLVDLQGLCLVDLQGLHTFINNIEIEV